MSNANVVVKGSAYWAQLEQVNQYSNKYQVDLSNLSAKAVEALQEMGITVKNKGDDRGFFITCKSTYPIVAQTPAGEGMEGIAIGNGSGITAVVSAYSWTSPQGKKGVSPNLKKLVVNDLVVYEKEEDSLDLSEAL